MELNINSKIDVAEGKGGRTVSSSHAFTHRQGETEIQIQESQ
jgi:hypothetical protein